MTIEEKEWQDVVNKYIDIVCTNHPDSKQAVLALIKMGHISKRTIVQFMTLQMYPFALHENNGHMAAITDIAIQLNVSERTIWSIITKKRTK